MLALIQPIRTSMPLVLKQADFGEIVGELIHFILVVDSFWMLLRFTSEWAEAVVNSFWQVSASAAELGETATRLDGIFGTAIELVNTIGDVETWNPFTALMITLAGVLALLCFAFIAAFMGLTIAESYVIINASVLFTDFNASQRAREYAMATVRYAMSVGAKLFILTLIVDLIIDPVKQWQAAYNYDDASMWTTIGLAFICAYPVRTIPELATGMISGISAGGGSSIDGMAAAGAAGAVAAITTIATAGVATPTVVGITGAAGIDGAGAAGAAGTGAMGAGGLAGAIDSSFAGAGPAGGMASSASSAVSAGISSSTGGSAAAKGTSSAGSWVGGSAANSILSAAPVQPSSGIQQATKQAGKAAQGGDDGRSQVAPGSTSQQGASASSGGSPASSSVPSSSTDTTSDDAGSADSGANGKGASGHQVTEGVARGPDPISAIAVPGMKSVVGLSLGVGQPQSMPNGDNGDAPSMAPGSNSEPENVIRPADPVPPNDGGPKPGTKGEG